MLMKPTNYFRSLLHEALHVRLWLRNITLPLKLAAVSVLQHTPFLYNYYIDAREYCRNGKRHLLEDTYMVFFLILFFVKSF